MSASFPIVLVEVNKADKRTKFLKAVGRSEHEDRFDLLVPRLGAVVLEIMAEPICLADGPFALERIDGENVVLKTSEKKVNLGDVLSQTLSKMPISSI
jgi:hypothetical protein